MPTSDRKELMRVARSIADGRPVDWDLLAVTHPALRSRLDKMRRIEALAETSRNLAASGGADRGGAEEQPARWGPLEIVEKVGEGGFGEVYRAFDPVLQREVALKLGRRDPLGSHGEPGANLEEARRLARLRHPNVLTIHGVEVHDGRPGMWTDFIRGKTLEEVVRHDWPVPLPVISGIASDLCRALDAVHSAGIIHGDVKAANVMRDAGGNTILMDFGAGIAAEEASIDAPVTGTPLVMAPELLAGGRPSIASDIYALGVLFYRLAAGRYPIEASSQDELMEKHRKGTRLALADLRPDLPAAFARAVERALDSDPGARYATAAEMEGVLRASLGERPAAAVAEGLADRLHNLPDAPLRFIGREQEIRKARELLTTDSIVTLLGPGGAGKTRLAREIAQESAVLFRDGVYWVDLLQVSETDRVEGEIAAVLGLRESPSRSFADLIEERLRDRSALIVLDNCEHLTAACAAQAGRLIEGSREIRVLATSRELLSCPEERIIPVAPMPVPPEDRGGAASTGIDVADYESVRLFLDRAARARSDFVLTQANAGAVARICRRLDGIPLAIELAASRVRVMGVEEICRRLDESLGLLTAPKGDGSVHRATLNASIEWSYRLLGEEARALLLRLSVFEGRWSLDAAERICGDDGGVVLGEQVIDLVQDLVDRSLVQFHPQTGGTESDGDSFYSMLQMVREFASSRAREEGDPGTRRARHIRYFVDFSNRANVELYGPKQEEWLRRIGFAMSDLRASIRWSMEPGGSADDGAVIAQMARRYWLVTGRLTEGRAALAQLLAHERLAGIQRGRTLVAIASLAWGQGDVAAVTAYSKEALGILRGAGDLDGLGGALSLLASAASDQGRYDEARAMMEEALEIRRSLGQRTATAVLLANLGVVCARQGDLAGAGRRYEEARRIYEEMGDRPAVAAMLANLSATAFDLGDRAQAKELILQSIAIQRQSGNRYRLGAALSSYGRILIDEGNLEEARAVLVEGIAIQMGCEDQPGVAGTLERFASLFVEVDRAADAARLLGAADVLRETGGQVRHPGTRAEREAVERRIIGILGGREFARRMAEGRAMKLGEAVERATS